MISARQALALTDKDIINKIRDEFEQKIISAATKGKTHCELVYTNHLSENEDYVLDELMDLGYMVYKHLDFNNDVENIFVYCAKW